MNFFYLFFNFLTKIIENNTQFLFPVYYISQFTTCTTNHILLGKEVGTAYRNIHLNRV